MAVATHYSVHRLPRAVLPAVHGFAVRDSSFAVVDSGVTCDGQRRHLRQTACDSQRRHLNRDDDETGEPEQERHDADSDPATVE